MSQASATGTPGLWTTGNQLTAPEGALRLAENCVIRGKDVLEPRRGQAATALSSTISDNEGPITALHNAPGGYLLAHQATKLWGIDALGSTKWAVTGTYSAPDEALMRMHFANQVARTYFATSLGPQRLDPVYTGTPTRAGRRRPNLKWSASFALTNASGYLATGKSVAYRGVLVTVDTANRYLVSAPSNRVVLTNPAAGVAAIGGLVRTGGALVTVITAASHGLKVGDSAPMLPGEANFAAGTKVVTSVLSTTSFTYAEAGANVASGAEQTFTIGAASANVVVSFVGTGATTSTIVRLYRSVTTTYTPGEDVYLVFEGKPSAGDISAGYMTVSDNTPDSLVGDAAYFSASTGTLAAAKEEPPWCKTLELFGERMYYANCRARHLQLMQLLATGGSSGVVSGTTFTIAAGTGPTSIVCTGSTVYSEAGKTFAVYSGGSVSQDVERTALGLVDLINNHPDNAGLVRARYLSGADDSPGKFEVESLDDSTTSFTVASTKGTAFNPQVSSAVTSRQESKPNRIYISEPSEPDAVSPLAYLDVGTEDEQILRVIALRAALLVLKERSLWVLSGDWPNVRRTLVDPALQLIAPDSAAVLANQVFALTSQGVAVLSESGVGLVGLPVEEDLLPIMLDGATLYSVGALTLRRCAWGVGYETERQYLLGVRRDRNAVASAADGNDASTSQVYVYNVMAKTWTRWTMERSCAAVERTSNRLWLGDATKAHLWKEAKTLTRADYADLARDFATFLYRATAVGTGTVTLNRVDGLAVGDALVGKAASSSVVDQAAAPLAVITAIEGLVASVTSTSGVVANTTDFRVAKAFECILEYAPEAAGAPALSKLGQEAALHFKSFSGQVGELWTGGEVAPLKRAHTFGIVGYGAESFGSGRWGSPAGPRNERAAVSRDAARSVYSVMRFRCAEALSFWQLQGRTLTFEVESERTRR